MQAALAGNWPLFQKGNLMINTDALDNVIAVVIVLLALSLIVQAIQAALKKLFKIKSLHIEQSLVHLLYYALDKEVLSSPKSWADNSPLLQKVLRKPHSAERDPEVMALYEGIVKNLRQLGRVTQKGTLMLDSISREDLKKCLEKTINELPTQSPGGEKLKAMQDRMAGILAQVDAWYGTVMQSFEERYTRSMKTWTLVISTSVVILLNANFFGVYRNIAISEAMRNNIMQTQGEISKRLAETAPQAQAPTAQTLKEWYEESSQAVIANSQFYTGFGFTNIKPRQVWQWVSRSGGWENVAAWPWLAHGLSVLAGLTIMTLLLSVGAPFWQDALESLFGIKNLLRSKSDTRNVEERSGEGQPRP
jgi:hypothetical protein